MEAAGMASPSTSFPTTRRPLRLRTKTATSLLRRVSAALSGNRRAALTAALPPPAPSSISRALSSTVWMIRELRGHTLPPHLDAGVVSRVRGDIDQSFCWLFQRVFARTPSLMLALLLLLADYLSGSVHSPEDALWQSVLDEAARLTAETRHPALADCRTLLSLVAPISVRADPDSDYPDYARTDLVYRAAVDADPGNPMILSNYAQFLFRVARDLRRAEHYFERAAEGTPRDAEALSKYAEFLWLGKQDLGKAEEMYLEAIDADPCNTALHSYYAHFLFLTGGEDTCYPLK